MRAIIFRSSLIGLTLIGAASAACQSGEDDSGVNEGAETAADQSALLDVNDVSFLFNIDKAGNPFPNYTLTGKDALLGIELLPARIVDQVTAAAKSQDPAIKLDLGGDKSAAWRIFAMRFDPCAPGINSAIVKGADGAPDKSKCRVQVRLIAQPLGQGAPQDITMHVVYTIGMLNAVNLEAIRNDLLAIKTAAATAGAPTAGQPLGVHPGLKKNDPGTQTALSAFLTKHVPQRLDVATGQQLAIAFMGLEVDGAEPWEFFAGAVVPDGSGAPTTFINLADVPVAAGGGMPSLPAGTRNIAFRPFAETQAVVDPRPKNLSTLPLFTAASDQSSTAFQIENPATNHFFNTDCVSCHTSTQKTVAFQTRSNSKRVRVPAGITGYVSPTVHQSGSWNLRNFGYFDTNPSVSLRTVNETVEVVQLMNKGHLSPTATNFMGPGNDCTAKDDAVFDCFLSNADGKGGSSCMAKNNCSPFPLDPVTAPPDSKPDPLNPLPDPSTDPCLAGPDKSGLTIRGNTITITGKANECFSRSFSSFKIHNPDGTSNGTFTEITCSAGLDCFVKLDSLSSPTTITGNDAARLTFLLGKVSADRKFVVRTFRENLPFDLTFECAGNTCTITPPARAALVSQ